MEIPDAAMDSYDQYAARLVGRSIVGATYYDDPGRNGEYIGRYRMADTAKLGIELQLDDGSYLSIGWGPFQDPALYATYPGSESMLIEPGESFRPMDDYQPWSMISDERWVTFLDRTITRVSLYREWDADHNRLLSPLDLVLEFAVPPRLFIAVGRIEDDTFSVSAGDNLIVVFDEQTAQRFSLGPYASRTHKHLAFEG